MRKNSPTTDVREEFPSTDAEWAFERLLERFATRTTKDGKKYGGKTGLARALTRIGKPVTPQTVQRWTEAPANWLKHIVRAARVSGIEVTADELQPELFPPDVRRRAP